MLGSCWMVFLQMPIFMGLYYALQESIFFRLQPFLWMPNLAAPDMLIYWGEKIPLISNPDHQGIVLCGLFPNLLYLGPFFNILPILAVALMIVQQKLTMPPPTDEQTAMQAKTMKYMMIFMGFMFYKVAAGLCMYFIASSLWGVAERKLIKKKSGAPVSPGPAMASASSRRGAAPPVRSNAGQRSRSARTADTNGDGFLARLREWWADILKQASKK
jgi:YidC/Oxa1 family membrane protein insertase